MTAYIVIAAQNIASKHSLIAASAIMSARFEITLHIKIDCTYSTSLTYHGWLKDICRQ